MSLTIPYIAIALRRDLDYFPDSIDVIRGVSSIDTYFMI